MCRAAAFHAALTKLRDDLEIESAAGNRRSRLGGRPAKEKEWEDYVTEAYEKHDLTDLLRAANMLRQRWCTSTAKVHESTKCRNTNPRPARTTTTQRWWRTASWHSDKVPSKDPEGVVLSPAVSTPIPYGPGGTHLVSRRRIGIFQTRLAA